LSSSLQNAIIEHARYKLPDGIIWGIEEGDSVDWPLHKFVYDKKADKWNKEPVCVMISGHMDWTQNLFDVYYKPVLHRCLLAGCKFVVGTASGVDTMAQKFLASQDPKVDVTVYDKKGYSTYAKRDAAMTAASDIDVAFLSQYGGPGSATAENMFRRARLNASLGVATLSEHMVPYDPDIREYCVSREDK